jgi:hypothetical protein
MQDQLNQIENDALKGLQAVQDEDGLQRWKVTASDAARR